MQFIMSQYSNDIQRAESIPLGRERSSVPNSRSDIVGDSGPWMASIITNHQVFSGRSSFSHLYTAYTDACRCLARISRARWIVLSTFTLDYFLPEVISCEFIDDRGLKVYCVVPCLPWVWSKSKLQSAAFNM